MQVACFHDDKDTLEMHSNVAGTGKAGAKVVAALDIQLKECSVSRKCPAGKGVYSRRDRKSRLANSVVRFFEERNREAKLTRGCKLKCESVERPNLHLGPKRLALFLIADSLPINFTAIPEVPRRVR